MFRLSVRMSCALMGAFALGAVVATLATTALRAQAPAAQSAARAERTAWYFYRVTWGFQDEFVDLFQKNH